MMYTAPSIWLSSRSRRSFILAMENISLCHRAKTAVTNTSSSARTAARAPKRIFFPNFFGFTVVSIKDSSHFR